MTKSTKWHVHPAKTQFNLGIPPSNWSESLLALKEQLKTQAFFKWRVKTLIRLGGCSGWSESSVGAHAILLVLSWCAFCNYDLKSSNIMDYKNFTVFNRTTLPHCSEFKGFKISYILGNVSWISLPKTAFGHRLIVLTQCVKIMTRKVPIFKVFYYHKWAVQSTTIRPVCPAKTQIKLGIHSVWSDLSCALWVAEEPKVTSAKTRSRLGGCPGWSENLLCAQVILLVLSCLSSYSYRNDPKFSDRYAWANSADPNQTAPRGAVWSGSTLFVIPSASFGHITLW